MGFELINAILNDNSKDVNVLYKKIVEIRNNELLGRFESALLDSIGRIDKIIRTISMFKGNNRTGKINQLHTKYQILSLIASYFRFKYEKDSFCIKNTWDSNKKTIETNMLHHYVDGILIGGWQDGGQGKLYQIVRNKDYENPIPKEEWERILNNWFEETLSRKQVDRIANPDMKDRIFINAIYRNKFTWKDQSSDEITFDIEHLAPKTRMKKLIKNCKDYDSEVSGLPINSFANLCYLPEGLNRSKGKSTIYEVNMDPKDLIEVEVKYSFTQSSDLEWIKKEYDSSVDLKEEYIGFLRKRFDKQKKEFFISLGIIDSS